MKTEISMNEWMKIQKALTKVRSWNECPPDASFSMAGESHSIYTDGKDTYEAVSGNGFTTWYKHDVEGV